MLIMFLEESKRIKGNTNSTILKQKEKERPPPQQKNPQNLRR